MYDAESHTSVVETSDLENRYARREGPVTDDPFCAGSYPDGFEIDQPADNPCRWCGDELSTQVDETALCSTCRKETQRKQHHSSGSDHLDRSGIDSSIDTDVSLALEQDLREACSGLGFDRSDVKKVLGRIDGAGNEPKFRRLHVDGDWEQEDEYDDLEDAVVGYLRILAFYSQLDVSVGAHCFENSALFDEELWTERGQELLETAYTAQAGNEPGERIHGDEMSFDTRLEQMRRQLDRR